MRTEDVLRTLAGLLYQLADWRMEAGDAVG